jgi:radical SAM enzyme (TIGR01210 family)
MNVRKFLNLVGSSLRKNRPLIPSYHNYTIKDYNGFIHFWFRTQGCKYTRGKNGGCLMCDYSSSSQASIKEMKNYILEGLNQIDNTTYLLLINSSGSFFDETEVPKEIRLTVYKQLEKFSDLEIILETLLETVSRNKLEEIRNILKTQTIDIEFGIESLDKNILKYCVNKKIDIKTLSHKIDLIHKYNMNAVANILVGIPFLSEYQNVEFAIDSINSLIKKGVDTVVLFPINIKPYTTIYWLYNNNFYKSISLWSYIEILNRIDYKYLKKIELSWYRDTSKNPIYKDGVKAPTTCSKCSNKVLSLLDSFAQNRDNRLDILNSLNNIKCDCKINWKKEIGKTNGNLKNNIIMAYREMANNILGENFWQTYGNDIEKEIENDFKSI